MLAGWRAKSVLNLLRHSAAAVIAAIVLIGPEGCHRRPARVALLTPTTGVIIWDAVHTGAVLEGRECGVAVHYDGPPREDDLRTQLAQFEQASESHFQVVAIAPIQMQAFRNPVERATQKGTPVIVIGDDLGIRNSNIAYVFSDDHLAGKLAADKVAELLHGAGSVAVLGIDFGQPSSLAREQSFERALTSRYKDIHVVERKNGTTNLFQEQQTAADLLSESIHVDAIVALSASATRGAFYALKAKYAHPPLHLVGFDQDLVVPLIDHEMDAVIGLRATDIGQTVARLACDRINGKKWDGPYVLSPVVLTPETYPATDVERQLHGGGWWKGEE